VADPLVHLELHTGNLARACAFYARLCGWRIEPVASYHAFEWDGAIGGGVVECGTEHAAWLPYVEVASVERSTALAVELGAAVLLPPRDGPAGRRSVVSVPDGAELALWQSR